MKRVILFITIIAGSTFVFTSCTKAETANTKKAETTATVMHDHEGHNHTMMKTDTDSAELVTQKTCPVMGNPINKDLYVDHDGKRVYVCCGACISAVKKSPEKYLKKLSELGEKPETL